ncbi:hypothetical protein GE09DRAFT_1205020 [Coniochaeta sp. 2T2.1]|nr:hypothetical protein GE09DRAFT_1205020 [Coniochaeta sp. 2T2.1]
MDSPPPRRRPPIHSLNLRYLLIAPVLLAIATFVLLFQHGESINIPFLWSQCHARSRLPWLSHIPLLGSPACFLVSFFQEAVASSRGFAIMAACLSFIAGLLTVSTVESARVCNGPAVLIAYPTGAWVVFNLLGGAVVWELVILPAFFVRSRQIILARREGAGTSSPGAGGGGGMVDASHPDLGEGMRHLSSAAEAVAIPVAVAVGCVLPSVLMLVLDSPVAVVVWIFFPLWVSLVRQGVRAGLVRWKRDRLGASLHLERSRLWTGVTYGIPVLCSVLAHVWLLYSLLARHDDRKEMTRATTKFIEIDVGFIGLTVLYWLFVEAGWRVAAVMLAASVLLGPGAGVCLAWVYREGMVDPDRSVKVVAVGARTTDAEPSEETPLLR